MRLAAALLLLVLNARGGVVSDAGMGYSIDLPANWVQVRTKETQHHFKDASGQFKSRISIVEYAINPADYPTPRDWTQAQFIAYKVAVETSVFPFGSVNYFDSSATAKVAGQWSPEAFSILYPADGTPTYCEYLRYVAREGVGYEIYAIGDSADMTSRIDFYAGIIQTLTLTTPASITPWRGGSSSRPDPALPILEFDARGRLLVPSAVTGSRGVRLPWRSAQP